MVTVILTHQVQDYANWKNGFDAGELLRSQNGITVSGVYTSVDDPNKVTIVTEFPAVEAVHGFLNNPQLKEDMQKAGIVGAPEIKILKKM